jgi:hypothetical protein
MSEHDYSGIDEGAGRWWGPVAGTAFVVASLIVLAVIVVFVGQWASD